MRISIPGGGWFDDSGSGTWSVQTRDPVGLVSGYTASRTFTIIPSQSQTISPTAIASEELVTAGQINHGVYATAIASSESVPGPVLLPGQVTVVASGIASSETFGSLVVLPGAVTIIPTGIMTLEALGDPGVVRYGTIEVESITSDEDHGSPQVNFVVPVGDTASGENVSEPQLNLRVFPATTTSDESFGVPTLATLALVVPNAISSVEVVGQPSIQSQTYLMPVGMSTEEVFGTLQINRTVLPLAISTTETFGVPNVATGAVTVSPAGIASAESLGIPIIEFIYTGSTRVNRRLVETYVHEIVAPDGFDFPDLEDDWEAIETVPGGYATASGTVSDQTIRDNQSVYQYGAVWNIYCVETGELVWRGKLLDPEPQDNGRHKINAKGLGTKADRSVERLLYAIWGAHEFAAADEEPFNYKEGGRDNHRDGGDFTGPGTLQGEDNKHKKINNHNDVLTLDDLRSETLNEMDDDETYNAIFKGKIDDSDEGKEAKVRVSVHRSDNGNEIDFIERKWDDEQADQVASLSWTPIAGVNYEFRVKLISGQARPILTEVNWGKTADYTSGKIHVESRGKRIAAVVDKGTSFKGGEGSAVVLWAYDQPLRRFYAKIDKERNSEHYEVELLATDKLDGKLKSLDKWNLDEGGPKTIDVDIPRSKDYELLMLRVKRKEGHQQKNSKNFRVLFDDIKIYGIAKRDDYATSDVVRDIAGRIGLDDGMVMESDTNILPYDVQDGTFADVLDEMAVFDDWRWLVLDNGVLDYGPWDRRVWMIDEPEYLRTIPLERYNVVRIPYRVKGKQQDWLEVRAEPNPFLPGIDVVYEVQLDDPLPPYEVAKQFAEKVVDYMSRRRAGGTCEITRLQSLQGVDVPTYKLHAGDEVVLRQRGNQRLRVKQITRKATGCTMEFDDGNAMLDMWQAKRVRRLAMGKSASDATLPGHREGDPDRPDTPVMRFKVHERRDRLDYDMVVDWSAVTTDEFGNKVEVQDYEVEMRPMIEIEEVDYNAANPDHWTDGTETTWWKMDTVEPNEGHIRRKTARQKEDKDGNDPNVPTKVVFERVPRPKKWFYQARVRAKAAKNDRSKWSEWTDPVLPFATAPDAIPPQITGSTIDFDRHDKKKGSNPLRAVVEWDEILSWDIPGGDDDSDLAGYIIQFRKCDEDGNEIAGAKVHRRFIPSKKDDDAGTRVEAIFHAIKRNNYYQYRIRTVSIYGHKGPWYGGI